MRLKKIIRLFENGNVCVTGLRGTGKDVLMGNVICRRKKPYISNIPYDKRRYLHIPLRLNDLDIKNNYSNFLSNDIKKYEYPYPKQCDIYVSDSGVYLPSQYCNKLNNQYEGLVSFQALSRQIGQCNFHINAQNLNRVWDKVREQSDIYIRCKWCKVIFKKFVIQKVYIYDKYESCINRVDKCKVFIPLFSDKVAKMQARTYIDNFNNIHGKIKTGILIYKNKSIHNTLYFGDLLKYGGGN